MNQHGFDLSGKYLTFRNRKGGCNFRGRVLSEVFRNSPGYLELLMKPGELEMQMAGEPEHCWHPAGRGGDSLTVRLCGAAVVETTHSLRIEFPDGRRLTISELEPHEAR